MKELIHLNEVRKILNSGQEVNLKLWKKKDGSILEFDQVHCTSSHFRNNTFNLKFRNSREIRTVRAVCLFEINGKEIFI